MWKKIKKKSKNKKVYFREGGLKIKSSKTKKFFSPLVPHPLSLCTAQSVTAGLDAVCMKIK